MAILQYAAHIKNHVQHIKPHVWVPC